MVARRELWVIDPSVQCPEDQGVREILKGWTGGHRLLRPALDGSPLPDPGAGDAVAGLVVMGSGASVYDDLPWLQGLSAWLAPLVLGAAGVPILGICFGHQLIAHLAGAPVAFSTSEHRKRLGVETTKLSGGRLLPGEHDLRVVVSHREVVEQVPVGYRRTATRAGCSIDGLEHESLPIFSFQFHPEAREEFGQRAGIDPRGIDDRVRRDSRRVLEGFLAQVATASPSTR